MTPLIVILAYLALLLAVGLISTRFSRHTSADYFVASRSIGPFMLLMSLFGTTMTAFSLVGAANESYKLGIGVYGLMASSSGLVHAAVFFLVGIRLWAIGKRHGYVTQIQFFRARFDSEAIGPMLFPILVVLVIPYLLIGIMGAALSVQPLTAGAFPDLFDHAVHDGGIPGWLTGIVVCAFVLTYVFAGGSRGTAWANTFQTLVFMATAVVAFVLIANKLGGPAAAFEAVRAKSPALLTREGVAPWKFATYMFIPLSVGMFPHVFQHWLTARSAKSFRLAVIAHPLCILLVWAPCVLIGVWAAGLAIDVPPRAVLPFMVGSQIQSSVLTGILGAGILAAIMSSLDSQFLCLGTMFTNDIVLRFAGPNRFSDKQKVWIARGFVVAIVVISYVLAMVALQRDLPVFGLAVWCFTGFSALTPIVFAALYWRRATVYGAMASIFVAAATWGWFFYLSDFAKVPVDLGTAINTIAGTPDKPVTGIGHTQPVAICTLASAATMFVVSLITKPPHEFVVEKFFPEADA